MLASTNTFQYSKVHGKNETKSGFTHLDFNLTDAWRVSGGGRYSKTEIGITINNPQAISVLTPVVSTQNRWDWLISTDYKINDDMMLYATASSGSRPPGLTTIVSTARQLAATPGGFIEGCSCVHTPGNVCDGGCAGLDQARINPPLGPLPMCSP